MNPYQFEEGNQQYTKPPSNGKITLNIERLYVDEYGALNLVTLSANGKTLHVFGLVDQLNNSMLKDGEYKTTIRTPASINKKYKDSGTVADEKFITKMKGVVQSGLTTSKDYPVFQFKSTITGHGGNSIFDSAGCEVFGTELKDARYASDEDDARIAKESYRDKNAPGYSHQLYIEDSRTTLKKMFNFIHDADKENIKLGLTTTLTTTISSGKVVSKKGLKATLLNAGEKGISPTWLRILQFNENSGSSYNAPTRNKPNKSSFEKEHPVLQPLGRHHY